MHLWLLRHGDALHPPGISDAERPLSPLGRQQARRVGSFISRHSSRPQSILSSPLRRARQTAGAVRTACGLGAIDTTLALLSGASVGEVLHELQSRKEDTLLLVGHEPLISTLTSSLASGHAGSFIRFTPCTLALLHYSGRPRPDCATLDLVVPPASLMRGPSSTPEK